MVEAVIALPVLIALLVALSSLHGSLAARQRALGSARHCGFAHALGGCGEVPAVCQAPPMPGAAPAPDPRSDVAAIARDAGASSSVFGDVPLLGDALAALLGDTIEARGSAATRQRADGVEHRVEGALLLVCNERPRDVLAIAGDLFCRHLPLLDCGGAR
jgi:hypothetical protein